MPSIMVGMGPAVRDVQRARHVRGDPGCFVSVSAGPNASTMVGQEPVPPWVTRRLSQVSTVRPEHDDKLLPDVTWICHTVASPAEWR